MGAKGTGRERVGVKTTAHLRRNLIRPKPAYCELTLTYTCFDITVAPDTIHHHVKTCRDNMKNMHFIAPEYGGKSNIVHAHHVSM